MVDTLYISLKTGQVSLLRNIVFVIQDEQITYSDNALHKEQIDIGIEDNYVQINLVRVFKPGGIYHFMITNLTYFNCQWNTKEEAWCIP